MVYVSHMPSETQSLQHTTEGMQHGSFLVLNKAVSNTCTDVMTELQAVTSASHEAFAYFPHMHHSCRDDHRTTPKCSKICLVYRTVHKIALSLCHAAERPIVALWLDVNYNPPPVEDAVSEVHF
jgi:hypothetical protein